MNILLLIYVAALCYDANASTIQFSAYPSVLKANLTSSAAMRCSLKDTSIIGRRDVTSTVDDVRHITSIVVTRNNGTRVAEVTSFDPPTALADVGNMEVKGDLTATSSEGLLELTWRNPSTLTPGEYTCEVNALTSSSHNVVFSTSLEILVEAPSIMDVLAKLNNMQKDNNEFNILVHTLQDNDVKQKATIDNLQHELAMQKTTIEALENCTSSKVAFMATKTIEWTITIGKTVVYDKEITNIGNGYNPATGVFTCPQAGLYHFDVHQAKSRGHSGCLQLTLNSHVMTSLYSYYANIDASSASAVLNVKKGDIVQIVTRCGATLYQDSAVVQANTFAGFLIQNEDC